MLTRGGHEGEDDFHPGWDYIRQGNDRDLALFMQSLPRTMAEHSALADQIFRPGDFEAWRRAASDLDEGQERFLLLLSLVEADDAYWIHLGY